MRTNAEPLPTSPRARAAAGGTVPGTKQAHHVHLLEQVGLKLSLNGGEKVGRVFQGTQHRPERGARVGRRLACVGARPGHFQRLKGQ